MANEVSKNLILKQFQFRIFDVKYRTSTQFSLPWILEWKFETLMMMELFSKQNGKERKKNPSITVNNQSSVRSSLKSNYSSARIFETKTDLTFCFTMNFFLFQKLKANHFTLKIDSSFQSHPLSFGLLFFCCWSSPNDRRNRSEFIFDGYIFRSYYLSS